MKHETDGENDLSGSDLPVNLDPSSIMEQVDAAYEVLRMGGDRRRMKRIIDRFDQNRAIADLVADIVLTRKRSGEKFERGEDLYFTSEGLRWATPEIAADHCSRRLAGVFAADLTCGQGGQILSLAEYCDKALAIDLNPVNTLITRMNLMKMDLDNVQVITGDCLSEGISNHIEGGAIFCDPSRADWSPRRTLEELEPDPRAVIEKYGERVSGFCFELPPYISLNLLPFDFEAEYVSIEGRINRLNVYMGKFRRSQRSAVVLPEGKSISGDPEKWEGKKEELIGDYIFEIDPSLVRSGLMAKHLSEVNEDLSVIVLDKRRTLVSSCHPVSSPFFRSRHILLGHADKRDLKAELEKVGAGSVTLRWKIPPSEYWERRNEIEEGLTGSRKVQLFKWRGYILTEKREG